MLHSFQFTRVRDTEKEILQLVRLPVDRMFVVLNFYNFPQDSIGNIHSGEDCRQDIRRSLSSL